VPPLAKKLIVGGLLGIVLAGASCFFPVISTLQNLCNWIGDLGPVGVFILAVLLAAGSLIFLPASPFVIIAAAVFGFAWGLVGAVTGVALGAASGFLISRRLLRKDISTQFRKHATFCAIDTAIKKEGWKIVILFRLCPISFGLANYLCGLTAVQFRGYLFATLLGSLPSTFLFCQLGSAGKAGMEALVSGHAGESTSELVFLGFSTLATIATIFFIPRFARKAVAKYRDIPVPAVGNNQ
jgi:uncharacterized membrane protein YdjX (TVP38/TMEM64 family)